MKVYLYVTPFFPSPTDWRGSYGFDFVKALQKQGVSVSVFTEGDGRDYEIGGVRVWTFRTRRLPSNIFPNLFARANQKSFLRAVARAGVNLEDVAVCHGNTANYAIYPLAVKRLNAHCKTLLHHHDLASFGLNLGVLRRCWLYNLILFPILRRLHEAIDTHVFISEQSRRSFLSAPNARWTCYADYQKQMRGLPYRAVRIKDSLILHNGVDTTLFTREPRTRLSEAFTIGCVGNFMPLKGQFTLLKAVALLKLPIKLAFIGSGETLEACRKFAQEHHIDVEFRSEVRHEELPNFYRSIDLFVLPSYFEGFGCVYTEAWACGTPFIACEGQGIEDVISAEDRHLWLCKPCDPIDLAAKIKYYITNRPQQKVKGSIEINELTNEFLKRIGEGEAFSK